MIHIGKRETRKCPKEFQDRITRMFGVNQFGDPHFKIVWGQSQFIKMGNVYTDRRGHRYAGYRERYQAHAMPCWVIMRWKPASMYGSPASYYPNSYMSGSSRGDDPLGFYVTAEYPWRGRYEVVQPLINKEFVGGELKVTHFPLSHLLIDMVIPLIILYQSLSVEEREVAQALAHEAEEKKTTQEIADRLADAMPAFWGPTLFGATGATSSLLAKKMEAIEKIWNRMSKDGSRPVFSRGLAQGARPQPIAYKS